MVAEVEGDEGDAGLDEAAGEHCLLTPEVLAVAVADGLGLLGEVERLAGAATEEKLDGLAVVDVQGVELAGTFQLAAEAVEVAEQGAAVEEAVLREAGRQAEEVAGGFAAGIDADVGINREPGSVVGDEGVVAAAEVTGVGEVGTGGLKGDVRGHARSVGPAVLGDDGADGGVLVALGIDAGGGESVAGLEGLVGLVIAAGGIDGAEDRELVEHGRLLRQVLADDHAGDLRLDDAEGAAVLDGSVGLGVPGVDLTGAAGHPEEDDGLVVRAEGLAFLGGLARAWSKPGRLRPATPARPALSILRRLKTTRPSGSRVFQSEKAWSWSCRCGRASLMRSASASAGSGSAGRSILPTQV